MMRRILIVSAFAALALCWFLLVSPSAKPMVFPDGKRFAFSIIDDTDMTTLERVRPVYAVLEKYRLRTTKTVWVYGTSEPDNDTNHGDSLADPEYREFVLGLQRKGFEIAIHGVRGGSSIRADIEQGLEEFKNVFGSYPRMHVNHSLNRDNLYWGGHLFAFAPLRWFGGLANRHEFAGHDASSPHFWGDLAQQRIRYVRRYTFPDVNLLNMNPSFPYKLAEKPFVNYWFPTADGDRILEFDELLRTENIERLAREGGVCLVYAHLGAGSFNKRGTLEVDPRFEARIKELAARDGWFAPASEILDHLAKQPSWTGSLTLRERLRLDLRYVLGQLLMAF